MIEITCPHCEFSKKVDFSALPAKVNKATCPRCRESFPLKPSDVMIDREASAGKSVTNPLAKEEPAVASHGALKLPKAGFWIRLVAALLDGFLVLILQGMLGGLLFLVGVLNGSATDGVALLVQIFIYLLSFVYYVFFTGYCGQTPGKMAVRIKIIRCDGSSLTYPRAAYREIPAKFISGIIFCIGYVMVAFDEQKQGLHDRMADTYVIKL